MVTQDAKLWNCQLYLKGVLKIMGEHRKLKPDSFIYREFSLKLVYI